MQKPGTYVNQDFVVFHVCDWCTKLLELLSHYRPTRKMQGVSIFTTKVLNPAKLNAVPKEQQQVRAGTSSTNLELLQSSVNILAECYIQLYHTRKCMDCQYYSLHTIGRKKLKVW